MNFAVFNWIFRFLDDIILLNLAIVNQCIFKYFDLNSQYFGQTHKK